MNDTEVAFLPGVHNILPTITFMAMSYFFYSIISTEAVGNINFSAIIAFAAGLYMFFSATGFVFMKHIEKQGLRPRRLH